MFLRKIFDKWFYRENTFTKNILNKNAIRCTFWIKARLILILGNIYNIFNTWKIFIIQVLASLKTFSKITIKHTLSRSVFFKSVSEILVY